MHPKCLCSRPSVLLSQPNALRCYSTFTACIFCAALQAVFVVAYFKHNFLDRHLRNHVQAAAEVCLYEITIHDCTQSCSPLTRTLVD